MHETIIPNCFADVVQKVVLDVVPLAALKRICIYVVEPLKSGIEGIFMQNIRI